MKNKRHICVLNVFTILVVVACSLFLLPSDQSLEIETVDSPAISESQVIEIVWNALEPNTSSHNSSNWQVAKRQLITGESVIDRFEGGPVSGCWFGPKPDENKDIKVKKLHGYVLMIPTPATPASKNTPASPTAPPLIPEPFLREAHFLVDPDNGEIVARKLICVVY